MNKIEKIFWKQWEKKGTRIIAFKELELFTKWDSKRVNLYLKRLVKAKRIKRIAKGYYTLTFVKWQWKELLRKIPSPCYLTGLWVLSKKGIYSEDISEIEGRICSQNRKIWTERGILKCYRDGYFSLEGVDEKELIANPEKAFADFIEVMWKERRNIRLTGRKWNMKKVLKLNLKKVKEYGRHKKRKVKDYINKVVETIKIEKSKLKKSKDNEQENKIEIIIKKEARRIKNLTKRVYPRRKLKAQRI